MKHTYFIFCILTLTFTCVKCSSSPDISISEESDKKTTTKASEEISEEEGVPKTKEQKLEVSKSENDSLNLYISRIIELDNDHESDYYMRYASIEGTFGNVYFLNGKVKKVTFSESEIGINGMFICYYDNDENLVLIATYDHANTWYREDFFVLKNDTLYDDSNYGEYANSLPLKIELKKAKESWMNEDLYFNTKRRAKFLKEEAIYNQQTLTGTRYYQGFIDGKYEVFMKLNEYENWGSGQYHYKNATNSLQLFARFTNDSIVITEKLDDSITGVFNGIRQEDYSIKGEWVNADSSNTLPFVLKPSNYYLTTNGNYLKSIDITPEDVNQYGNQVFGVD